MIDSLKLSELLLPAINAMELPLHEWHSVSFKVMRGPYGAVIAALTVAKTDRASEQQEAGDT